MLKVPLMQYVERMDKSFYYYDGSLTTPPCTESAHFIIMNEIQYLTFADMDQFQRFWGGNRRFANGRGNNRAVQPLNGRTVYFREVTQEERYKSLTNHFMMPDTGNAVMAMSVAALAWLSLLSILC